MLRCINLRQWTRQTNLNHAFDKWQKTGLETPIYDDEEELLTPKQRLIIEQAESATLAEGQRTL